MNMYGGYLQSPGFETTGAFHWGKIYHTIIIPVAKPGIKFLRYQFAGLCT
jgi:hypothetical protein